jgi:hypothetical protein
MAAAKATKIQPITADTFNANNLTYSKPHDMPDYGYRSVRVGYNRSEEEGTTDDNLVVKVSGMVTYVANNDKKFTALVKISEQEVIDLLTKLNDDITKSVFDNRKDIFANLEVKGKTAIEKLKTQKLLQSYSNKKIITYNEKYGNYSIAVEFLKSDITISHMSGFDDEIVNSNDVMVQLPTKTNVVIPLNINKLSINMKTLKWSFKLTTNHIVCINQNEATPRAPHEIKGVELEDVDTSTFKFSDVITNSNNGRKIKMSTSKGSLNIVFNNKKCVFTKKENEDGSVSYSVGIPLGDNPGKFTDIDDTIMRYIFENQKDLFGKVDNDDFEVFQDNFKESVSSNDNGEYMLWAKFYYQNGGGEKEEGFGDTFYSVGEDADGNTTYEKMSLEDTISQVFNHKGQIQANLAVYHRHIWLGNQYTNSWTVGKAHVSTSGRVDYDMGLDTVPRDEEVDEFDEPSTAVDEEPEDETAIASDDEDATSEEED